MKCHSQAFQALPADESWMSDFQELRIQDEMQSMDVGVVPQSIAVALFGDLVGSAQPGDAVAIEGIVQQRWRSTWQGKRVEVELFIEATHVERLARDSSAQSAAMKRLRPELRQSFEDFWGTRRCDEWQVRSSIISATAPWLSGLPVPKLALLLTLIGGAPSQRGAASGAGGESRWERFIGTSEEANGDPGNKAEKK